MKREAQIEPDNVEGLIFCWMEALGLYSVNHWEPLADFQQGLERSDMQFRWNILPIMWRMDLKGTKLQARGSIR